MPYKLLEPDPVRRQTHFRVRGTEFKQYLDRSTGTSNRRDALGILREWREQAKQGMFQAARGPTFASAALAYMQSGGERKHLASLLTYFGDRPLSVVSQQEIDTAAVTLYPTASPATRNRAVYTPISAVMRHSGHVIVLRRPKGGDGERRSAWLKPDEAKRLLEAASAVDKRFGIFCLFLLYTGCRRTEATRLTPANLNVEDRTVYVPRTKNGKPRLVHLPEHVARALAQLPAHLPRYGRTLFGLSNHRRAALMLEKAYAHAGIPKPHGVAFHIFRHTYGAYMRKFGGLDTTGLVATGAWMSRNAASVYEHAVTSEEARKADLLPVWE